MKIGEVYNGEPADIAAARHLASELFKRMATAGMPVGARVVADVQLVVSEMITNAVKFTTGPCGLDLRVVDDTVEITVWDTSERPVTAMSADPARVGRHGLEIVTALCGGFEVTTTPKGKRVTAQMALGTEQPAADRTDQPAADRTEQPAADRTEQPAADPKTGGERLLTRP